MPKWGWNRGYPQEFFYKGQNHPKDVVGQSREFVRHDGPVLGQRMLFTNHISAFLRHNAEFLDNGTQFNGVKGLIGSISPV